MMPGMRGMNPRQVKQAMRKLGIKTEDIDDVVEVVIRTKTKQYVIKEPTVSIMEMQGQKIFQVTGERIVEKAIEREVKIPEEDVQLVAMQAKVSVDQARAALEQTKGDLAQAILLLSQTR